MTTPFRPPPTPPNQRMRITMALRRRGIRSTAVLDAIEHTPREFFTPPDQHALAWREDSAIPIGCGQTMSTLHITAFMTEQLAPEPSMKVLEIGTGSGYHTALLARLARRVYTIERHRELLRQAEGRLRALRLDNVTTLLADGSKGWAAQSPFDRIIVTAAAAVFPADIGAQLRPGGVMMVPVASPPSGLPAASGDPDAHTLLRAVRTNNGFDFTTLMAVVFVPLVSAPPPPRTPL